MTLNPDGWLRHVCIIYKAGWGGVIKKGWGSCPDCLDELGAVNTVQQGKNLPWTRKMKFHKVLGNIGWDTEGFVVTDKGTENCKKVRRILNIF